LEDLKRFVLALVDVRRRTSARRNKHFSQKKGAPRFLARDEKRH
jgi:hypothetical protein